MTISIQNDRAPALVVKNLVTDQTWYNIMAKFNTAGVTFDATKGLGQAAANTTTVLVAPGGFADQRITATMQFPAPTTAGNEFIGVMLRCAQLDITSNYYYVCVFHSTARIVTVVNGTFTTVANVPFVLAQGQSVTITASAVGSTITGLFEAGGSPATVSISATDTNIASGFTGFTSITSAIWVSSIRSEQL